MQEVKKAKSPADFELVFGQGIHPFYLGMEADQVLEAAVGWKTVFSERDPGGIEIHFEKGGKIIEVCLIDRVSGSGVARLCDRRAFRLSREWVSERQRAG